MVARGIYRFFTNASFLAREWLDIQRVFCYNFYVLSQKYITRCGAVDSALALGAGHRPQGIPKQKTPKSLVTIDFFGTILSRKILNKSGLTTCLTTYGKKQKMNIDHISGCGPMVRRSLWERDFAGSIPVTPTKIFGFDRKIEAAGSNSAVFVYERNVEI